MPSEAALIPRSSPHQGQKRRRKHSFWWNTQASAQNHSAHLGWTLEAAISCPWLLVIDCKNESGQLLNFCYLVLTRSVCITNSSSTRHQDSQKAMTNMNDLVSLLPAFHVSSDPGPISCPTAVALCVCRCPSLMAGTLATPEVAEGGTQPVQPHLLQVTRACTCLPQSFARLDQS